MPLKRVEFQGDGEGLLELVFGILDGVMYLRIRRILDEIEKILGKDRLLILLLQVPLLSAQEEVGLVLQLLRNVV
ncbi:hypothetical protein [Thermococcus thermotolerans]|uniref:hypothetical protein n=1 Tax=Thermococcus thermotolerans TaxID=2969672 RepID=UPI00215853E0|nr:hypothetical protein [Thermococcus thermotolerans]